MRSDYVFADFFIESTDQRLLDECLEKFGRDATIIKCSQAYDVDYNGPVCPNWYTISCRMTSEVASIIKLQDGYLSERMKISYMPEEFK